MNIKIDQKDSVLLKCAISTMRIRLLESIESCKQQINAPLSAADLAALAELEQNPDNLTPAQVESRKSVIQGNGLADNIAFWENQILELDDLDKRVPYSHEFA